MNVGDLVKQKYTGHIGTIIWICPVTDGVVIDCYDYRLYDNLDNYIKVEENHF